MDSFTALSNEALAMALAKRGITTPTPVQHQAIPLLASGRDAVVSAETGSGKTLAYLIPIVCQLDYTLRAAQAVVLVPTHELAAQVYREADKLLADMGYADAAALLIGGANIQRQLDVLKKKPRVLVGSVGRLNELAELRKLKLHEVRVVVLDEADRLLDGDNETAVRAFLKRTLADRQIALFSASITAKTEQAASAFLRSPAVLRLNNAHGGETDGAAMPGGLRHIIVAAEQREKAMLLRKLFHAEKIGKGIVFVNNPHHIQNAAERLRFHAVPSAALYGEAMPMERRQALEDLRAGRAALLVASDMAARGLDIQGLTHVINLDVPEQAEAYLHRAGRVGRMAATGTVVTFATPREMEMLAAIARRYGFETEVCELAEGRLQPVRAKVYRRKTIKTKQKETKNERGKHETKRVLPRP